MTIQVYNENGQQVGYFNENDINAITEENLEGLFQDITFAECPFAFLYATKEELERFDRVIHSWAAGLDDSDYFRFHIEPEFTEMPLNTIYLFQDMVCNTISEHLRVAKSQVKFLSDMSSHVQSPLKKTLPQ